MGFQMGFDGGLMWFNGISYDIAPGKHSQFAIENGHLEIVDLPIHSMVIFYRFLYVYQRVTIKNLRCTNMRLCSSKNGTSPTQMYNIYKP